MKDAHALNLILTKIMNLNQARPDDIKYCPFIFRRSMNHRHQSGTVPHLFADLMRAAMFKACISLAFTGFVNYFY